MTSQELTIYTPNNQRDRAVIWAALDPAARRRLAAAAAGEQNTAALTELLWAYVLTKSRAHERTSDHTLRAYAAGVRLLCSHWHELNLLHPPEDAGDRYVAVLSRTLAPATIESRLAAAGALYRALRWARATTADPFAGVRAPLNPTPRHERRRPYPDDAVGAILAAADDRLGLVILLCAHAGLRISEALALEWDDCSFGMAQIRVRSGKGGKARWVHTSSSLRRALVAAHGVAEGAAVIVRRDGAPARDASWLRRQLSEACAAAGVDYLGWHALRHTAGTRLARETGSLQLVAAHLGHSDVSTTAIYAKWSDSTLAAAVAAW